MKFKGISIDLKRNNLDLSGNTAKFIMIQNITDAPTLTSIYIDLYIREAAGKFV